MLKAVAAAGAFAVPIIASFSMDAPAMAQERTQPWNPNCSNQTMWCANQTEHEHHQYCSNQTMWCANQTEHEHHQYCSNQTMWCANQTEHEHHHHEHHDHEHHHRKRRRKGHPWFWF